MKASIVSVAGPRVWVGGGGDAVFLSGSGLERASAENGITTSACQIMQADPAAVLDAASVDARQVKTLPAASACWWDTVRGRVRTRVGVELGVGVRVRVSVRIKPQAKGHRGSESVDNCNDRP